MFSKQHKAPVNKYPLWRYILIIVLVLVALLFALPNYFGENPAVQISPKGGHAITMATVNQVSQALKSHGLDYLGRNVAKYTAEYRFTGTSEQMKAQNLLQQTLGKDYTVAINLAPNTPKWLSSIGGHPMKLGLDLRGGMYFLLDVDMQTAINTKLHNLSAELRNQLRHRDIRYSGIRLQKEDSYIVVDFRDAAVASTAANYIRQHYPNVDVQTIHQVKRAPQLHISLTKENVQDLKNNAVKQTVDVMRNRVDELGVGGARVQREGMSRVVVELPGLQDAARAKSIIGGTATLKVQMVNTKADIGAALKGNVPIGSGLYYTKAGQPYVLHNNVVITGDAITGANVGYSQDTSMPVVQVQLSGPQVSYFSKVTGENVGRPMAIVLVQKTFKKIKVNGKTVTKTKTQQHIVNVATIQSRLGNNFQITGIGNSRAAQDLALSIRAGSLPAPVQIAEERQIGPTLGAYNIKMGTISILMALLLVVLFIAFYYSLFGLIANLALVLNLIFIIAIMSLLPGATLSLPGIAGIVLNLGMAIDANVLIFERIREELRIGTSPQAAIHAGYARAFGTIVDSNVTTLIVAVILFAIGTSAIKGFAVTLMIGILCSMFTSITVTRSIVNLIYGGKPVKWLSIGIKPKRDQVRAKS